MKILSESLRQDFQDVAVEDLQDGRPVKRARLGEDVEAS